VISRKEPVVIDDYVALEPYLPSRLVGLGVKSGAHVPIFGQGAVIGVLSAHARDRRRFTEDEVSFLRSVANILAIAIERKRAEDRLTHLAQFDTVTGLPNRHLFRDRLGQSRSPRRGGTAGSPGCCSWISTEIGAEGGKGKLGKGEKGRDKGVGRCEGEEGIEI
jgi:hypothetical protein